MTGSADLSAFAGVRAVVLGATGFVGRWVARALSEHGAALTLPVRDAAAAGEVFAQWNVRGEVHTLDLDTGSALGPLLTDVKPAVVFNLVGYGVDPAERDEATSWRINGDFPARLAELVASARDPGWRGAALLHAGTALEYGEERGDLAEDGPTHATTLYGMSKLAGTRGLCDKAMGSGMRTCVARLFTVYGPGEHPGRLLPSLLAARDGEARIPLTSGAQQRDFTYVEDVAEAMLRLAVAAVPPGTVVNCARGSLTTVRAFTEAAADAFGVARRRLGFGDLETRSWEMSHLPVTTERLAELIAWSLPSDVETGLRKTLRFAAQR